MDKTADKKYKVLMRIWHSGDNRYYGAGAKVAMAHLADFQIGRLIAQGVIEPIAPVKEKPTKSKQKQKEAEHGDIDGTGH